MEEEKDTESHSVCYAVPNKRPEVQIIDVMGPCFPSFPSIVEVFNKKRHEGRVSVDLSHFLTNICSSGDQFPHGDKFLFKR